MTDRPPPKISDSLTKPLPKRFYKTAQAALRDGAYAIELDGRAAKTPLKRTLGVASQVLATAMAVEWTAQGEHIDPSSMPITRLVTAAIDAVAGKEAAVAAEIVKYSGTDLTCYRADAPEGLVAAQAKHWDPVLAWAHEALGARFVATTGLMHVAQPPEAPAAIALAVNDLPALRLAALHVLTTMTGSALIALAHMRGQLGFDAAWIAAHVDEDWQIARWGEDFEAAERRRRRHADAAAAAFVLAHA